MLRNSSGKREKTVHFADAPTEKSDYSDDKVSKVIGALKRRGVDIAPFISEDTVCNPEQTDVTILLFKAAEAGHADLVRALIKLGAKLETLYVDHKYEPPVKRTPLQVAVQNGHYAVVKELLEAGASVDAASETGLTALYIAASWGHLAIIKLLHANGADINATRLSGSTPLFTATKHGQSHVVKWLLDKGVDANVTLINGPSALLQAVITKNPETVRHLSSKADVNAVSNEIINRPNTAKTALYMASGMGLTSIVNILIRCRADANLAVGEAQNTPLTTSAGSGYVEVMDALLEAKANVDQSRASGSTPLFLASQCDQASAVSLLLEKKANANSRHETGLTPLHQAATGPYPGVAKLLIDARADLFARTTDGTSLTPATAAKNQGYDHMAEFLEEAMAAKSGK